MTDTVLMPFDFREFVIAVFWCLYVDIEKTFIMSQGLWGWGVGMETTTERDTESGKTDRQIDS